MAIPGLALAFLPSEAAVYTTISRARTVTVETVQARPSEMSAGTEAELLAARTVRTSFGFVGLSG